MEEGSGEFGRFTKVWFTVFVSLTYCYFISKHIPKGFLRLLSVLPIISIFTLLPLNLSSLHLSGITGFFITFLANFKLLLFSFDMGPLSSDPHKSTPMTLPLFISLACLPIKIKQNPSHQNPSTTKTLNYYAIECLLLGLVLCIFEYKNQHFKYYPSLMMKFLYCFQMFFTLEILLAVGAALIWIMFGLEVEPPFDHPFTATSPQNFWGRRWNIVVSGILRSTVYEPVRHICSTRIYLGTYWGLYVAVLVTFVVSGLIHELILFYMGRLWPVWDVMWFFAINGICLDVEIAVKKAFKGSRWQLNVLVSRALAIGLLGATSIWWLYPMFERIGVEIIVNEEIAMFAQFVKGVVVNIVESFSLSLSRT